ncbi:MAG: LysM peptidoglycan-binding domain-containing protein [Alphaproteobacteria bacterium]|nr:LysM peptidoglycan-binding domain-containing protein [Alphaproteobacteria bacterium]
MAQKKQKIKKKQKKLLPKIRLNWMWVLGIIGAFSVALSIFISILIAAPEQKQLSQTEVNIANENNQTETQISYQQYQIAGESVLGFALVRMNNSGDAVIAGHAPENSSVIIELNGSSIGAAQVDHHGEWVFLTPKPLPSGYHRLTLEAISEDLTTKIYGDQSLVIIVPKKSVVIQGEEGDANQPLVVLLPSDSESGSRVLKNQFSADKTPLGANFTVNSIDYNNQGLLIIGGILQAKDIEILLYLDNKPIARKKIEGQGAVPVNWDVKVAGKISPGHYELRVDMVEDDRVVLRRILPVRWDELPNQNAQPETDFFIVQPGNSLWYIARSLFGEGAQHTTLYDANRQEIHDPDQIYPGQILLIPKAEEVEGETQ